jgi:hypothetical protein
MNIENQNNDKELYQFMTFVYCHFDLHIHYYSICNIDNKISIPCLQVMHSALNSVILAFQL